MSSLETSIPLLATTTTGLFTGSALYISVVQHPALFETAATTAFRVAYFKPMLARAAPMQGSLTLISGAAAIATGLMQRQQQPTASTVWLAAGVAMVAIFPFTFATIIPINKKLTSDAFVAKQSEATLVELLRRWGKLHGVRTAASLLAFGGMVTAISPSSVSQS